MNNTVDFKKKYLKYKEKYLKEKALQEGGLIFNTERAFRDLTLYSPKTGTEGFILTELEKFKNFLTNVNAAGNNVAVSKLLAKDSLNLLFKDGKYMQTTTLLSSSTKRIYPITTVAYANIKEDPPTITAEIMNACEKSKIGEKIENTQLQKSWYNEDGKLIMPESYESNKSDESDESKYYNVIIKIRFNNIGYHYIKHILILKKNIVKVRIDFSKNLSEIFEFSNDNFELKEKNYLKALQLLKELYDNRDRKWKEIPKNVGEAARRGVANTLISAGTKLQPPPRSQP